MEEKIRTILAGILEVDPARIDGGFSPDTCRDWDSLNNLRLITALEKEFAIAFSWPEISAMTDFAHICEVILRRQGACGAAR